MRVREEHRLEKHLEFLMRPDFVAEDKVRVLITFYELELRKKYMRKRKTRLLH